MIAPTQFAVRTEPATGQSFDCWLSEELSACGTGGTSLFTLTYFHASEGLPSVIAQRYNVTDPEAGFRPREPQLFNWAKNYQKLNTVAGMIIPGIRELTGAEQSNLRSVYQKLYRKA
jgi:hypothetical protein